MYRLAFFLMMLAVSATAQHTLQRPTTNGLAGTVRVLDKITGDTTDLEIGPGQIKEVGRLQVKLRECRFPTGNPNSDAYGWLDIIEVREGGDILEAFSGWMLASSPALNAMDHPRYDVWLLRCKTS